MSKELLIVFCKNPVQGKVKLRLARTIGDERALKVYQNLLKGSHYVVGQLSQTVMISYSDFIDHDDLWENKRYKKSLQKGRDLGERMSNAIGDGFKEGYDKVCLIGTDIPHLTSDIIKGAFSQLEKTDAVIGPARDGGYYLIGFSTSSAEIKNVFSNKKWSTSSVFEDTIISFDKEKLSYSTLTVLSDVDVEGDLPPELLET